MLVRDKAALLGQALNLSPYDALIDEFSPGISSNDIDAVFKTISRRLPSLIREVDRHAGGAARRCRSKANSRPAASAPWSWRS